MRTQWVFRNACGCPFGVLAGICAETEFDAWDNFYDNIRLARKARARGVTVEYMSHERYVAEVYPQLRGDVPCTHGSASAS